VGNHGGGPSPPPTHTGSASRRPASRPECPPLPLPGQNAWGVHGPQRAGTGRPHRLSQAIDEAAIALQLKPGYVQAPDRGGHPLRWRRIIAGQSSALKAGTAGRLAEFCPWLRRALMCGAEGKLVLRHGAGQAGAIDDGFGFDPGHGAEHVSDRVARAPCQPGPPRRRNIAPVCGKSVRFRYRLVMHGHASSLSRSR
jgi:hypothetical protein